MSSFVIEYNRDSGAWKVEEFTGFGANRTAILRRIELELGRPDDSWEIVALNSDSLETLRQTHQRYFQGEELPAAV